LEEKRLRKKKTEEKIYIFGERTQLISNLRASFEEIRREGE